MVSSTSPTCLLGFSGTVFASYQSFQTHPWSRVHVLWYLLLPQLCQPELKRYLILFEVSSWKPSFSAVNLSMYVKEYSGKMMLHYCIVFLA